MAMYMLHTSSLDNGLALKHIPKDIIAIINTQFFADKKPKRQDGSSLDQILREIIMAVFSSTILALKTPPKRDNTIHKSLRSSSICKIFIRPLAQRNSPTVDHMRAARNI